VSEKHFLWLSAGGDFAVNLDDSPPLVWRRLHRRAPTEFFRCVDPLPLRRIKSLGIHRITTMEINCRGARDFLGGF
jgi:hypothetical protein